jgi:hypothetical protein
LSTSRDYELESKKEKGDGNYASVGRRPIAWISSRCPCHGGDYKPHIEMLSNQSEEERGKQFAVAAGRVRLFRFLEGRRALKPTSPRARAAWFSNLRKMEG